METQANTVDSLLKMAREDLERSSLISAEKNLEQAVLINNQVPAIFYLLGQVWTKKGKFKKAILAFERALALDPFYTEASIALSSLYNDIGKYKEGANVYAKAKKRLDKLEPGFDPKINQQLAEKHFELGQLYLRYERFTEAHHEFAKALNLEPDNLLSALNMAKCLSKTGDKEGAISLLMKSLERHPKSADVRVQLGVLYHARNRLRDAYLQWQEAVNLDPENKMAQMYLSIFDEEPREPSEGRRPLSRKLDN